MFSLMLGAPEAQLTSANHIRGSGRMTAAGRTPSHPSMVTLPVLVISIQPAPMLSHPLFYGGLV